VTLRHRHQSAPLLFQVVGLLALAVIGTQAINVAVILSSPPPKPSNFLAGEVAEVLSGEAQSDSTAFAVTTERLPPYDNHEDPQERDYRENLARYLNIDASKVRVVLRAGRPGAPTPPGGSPPLGNTPPTDPGMPPPSILLGLNDGAGDGFAAAVQLPNDRWRVVRPQQDGWLAPWQKRALAWFLGAALLIAPLGYLFARRLTAPIRAFAEAAEQLGRDPQGPPMKLAGSAEIGAAAQSRSERFMSFDKALRSCGS
jgi:two-component system, OmpR family, sensor kinase